MSDTIDALEYRRLPVPSAMSVTSFRWALSLLHETPRRLVVHPDEERWARLAVEATPDCDVELAFDASLPEMRWRVEGATRAVVSE